MTLRWLAAPILIATTTSAYTQPTPPATVSPDGGSGAPTAAEAATEPPPTAAPPSATPPAPPESAGAGDVDLSSLGLEGDSASSVDKKLNIYGFVDFQYQYQTGMGAAKTFANGKFNVYFARNFNEHWRMLAEVRFLYIPNGSSSGATTTTTTASDPTDFNRTLEWGGVSIQRAYVEYDVDKHLSVRAGHWLTPYGVWNVDHGSPAIISAYAPHIIGEALFPEHQTGIEAFGNTLVGGDYRVSYAATVSNGRSPVETTQDPDHHFAYGGRLQVEAPLAGTLRLGISGYGGRSTVIPTDGTPQWEYQERDYAADGQWDHGPLHLQAEYIQHVRSPVAGSSPPVAAAPMGVMAPGSGETNTGTNKGYYVLGAYQFQHFWQVTPFMFYEDWRPPTSAPIKEINVGLNFRPVPEVVLKAMYSDVWLTSDAGGTTTTTQFKIFTTQAAWAF